MMLRYPGGKRKLYKHISKFLTPSDTYVEPFFGGGFIGLKCLENKLATRYVFNDKDYAIYSIWKSIEKYPKKLKKYLSKLKPTVQNFYKIKKLLIEKTKHDIVKTAAIKIAIHQWSYSGLGEMAGGPIGGKKQNSKYKINCRWNIESLLSQIDKYHVLFTKNNVSIYNTDALKLIQMYQSSKQTIIYIDPPYYIKGGSLYLEKFNQHNKLARLVETSNAMCIVSYDDAEDIKKMYRKSTINKIITKYSINGSTKKSELIICNFCQNK